MLNPVWWCLVHECTSNQIERMPCSCSKSTFIDLIAEREEYELTDSLNEKLGRLLSEIAVIVNGPEPPLTSWSWHDLPEKVAELVERVARLKVFVYHDCDDWKGGSDCSCGLGDLIRD